jgi:hypothetical protein
MLWSTFRIRTRIFCESTLVYFRPRVLLYIGGVLMTHDELLAKIDNFEPDYELEACKAMNALYAVVELHKPFEIDREGNYNCQECEWAYPCQTIQAIEKELG